MRFLILTLMLLISLESYGYSFAKNPIYHAIKILNKKIDKEKAMEYSNIIAKYSRLYSLDPFLLVSIARQESHIVLNTSAGHLEEEVILQEDGEFVKRFIVTDMCMMQIHRSNVLRLKLDPNRLLTSADYCIHEGAKILQGFKYLIKTDSRWWSRYNASILERRREYEEFILKHYKKIMDTVPNIYRTIKKYNSIPTIRKDGEVYL